MSLKLRELVAGDAVVEGGYVYEATSDAYRVSKPEEGRDGHECEMRALSGPFEGQPFTFFEALNAGAYGLKLERWHRTRICA